MNIPDVNVLVALFRPDHGLSRAATAWWAESVDRGEPFTVPDVVWSGFTRVVTNGRIFEEPASFAQAQGFVGAVVAQPTHSTWVAHPRTLEEFARIGAEASARGNLVTDAYIAACAATYGGTVVTFDRDYRRFDGLRVRELSA
ncbi:type II toxin-antitoxin system VapC family toxin [Nocardioides sp. W3-2-3]|uniref:TA system VapC family ribonuclease toxin n=1 Tax=Nocardioides convexus TaxID=2712224 RepID=UPI002418B917|nr:TA system VapC family ribonuclease toxin [Nocardioides convexus]NHA01742.1 type II toxin-antitoxin system VapC family toxin [Nocardioides convexus]